MPKFRNTRTGVVVNVDDEAAETLGPGYEPADAPKPPRSPRKRTSPVDDED